jgi:drug/metabolite transporter (DMT)-like permease
MICEISAQTLFKSYHSDSSTSINRKNVKLATGFVLYSLSGVFAFKILEYGSLGVINIIWHMLHFFALFIVSSVIFGEKYNTRQIVASLLACGSLYLFMTE